MEQTVPNRELILAAYANEGPVTDAHLKIRETQLDIGNVGRDGSPGDVLVQNVWISVDPYLRHLMKQLNDSLNLQKFQLNQAIQSRAVGKVAASANSAFEVGDIVFGLYQVSEYAVVPGEILRKIDTSVAKPSDYLGVLGMPSLTAWIGFTIIGNPNPGDEVFVSAAAGSVGIVVGQLAKIKGCRVVGSAGSDQKVKLLKEEFGFDDAFNYKSETDWDAALTRHFPMLFRLRHPNIIDFVAACKKPPVFCIITEYLPGGSLRTYLHKQEPHSLPLKLILKMALDIARGMKYLHSQGIMHRDLKSENLLLGDDMCVKVADFGVSCLESQCDTMRGFMGTYRWMAPEMIKEKPYTRKVDVYSFGIVLWELLTALIPFQEMTPVQAAFAVSQKARFINDHTLADKREKYG